MTPLPGPIVNETFNSFAWRDDFVVRQRTRIRTRKDLSFRNANDQPNQTDTGDFLCVSAVCWRPWTWLSFLFNAPTERKLFAYNDWRVTYGLCVRPWLEEVFSEIPRWDATSACIAHRPVTIFRMDTDCMPGTKTSVQKALSSTS